MTVAEALKFYKDLNLAVDAAVLGAGDEIPTRSNLTAYVPHSSELQKLVDGHILDDGVEGRITKVFGESASNLTHLIGELQFGFQEMAKVCPLEAASNVTFRGLRIFSKHSLIKEQYFCFQVKLCN